jgi:hypothetical protein
MHFIVGVSEQKFQVFSLWKSQKQIYAACCNQFPGISGTPVRGSCNWRDIGNAEHMEEVMSLTFKYIRVLQQQGVAEWMFEEVNSTCLLACFAVMLHLFSKGESITFSKSGHYFSNLNFIFDVHVKVRAVCEMKFHFQDKRPPISYVTDLAGNMLVCPSVMDLKLVHND